MLPKKNKLNLRSPENFSVTQHGFFWKGRLIHARFDFKTELLLANVTVPKKNIALATERNTWKRFLYQFLDSYRAFPVRLRLRVVTSQLLNQKIQEEVTQELLSLFTQIQAKKARF